MGEEEGVDLVLQVAEAVVEVEVEVVVVVVEVVFPQTMEHLDDKRPWNRSLFFFIDCMRFMFV